MQLSNLTAINDFTRVEYLEGVQLEIRDMSGGRVGFGGRAGFGARVGFTCRVGLGVGLV